MEPAFKALSNPHRLEILRLVWDRELSSSQIAAQLDVSWPAVSQNLKVLREAKLVTERRDGPRRLYRADRIALGPLEAFLTEMWNRQLDRLALLAERAERQRERPRERPTRRRKRRPS